MHFTTNIAEDPGCDHRSDENSASGFIATQVML
jgi:hypothetical protein